MLFRPFVTLLLLAALGSASSHEHVRDHRRSISASTSKRSEHYSALVVFGASYNDNAHYRLKQFKDTLRNYWPWSKWGGRYANGKIAVEYLAERLSAQYGSRVRLLDYAYGGSHVDNDLTGGTAPATENQVAQYLLQLSKNTTLDTGNGRVLHYINTGINPLTVIWNDAVNAGLSASAKSKALSRAKQNVNAIASQLRSISKSSKAKSKLRGIDYVVIGIPPLEIVPTFAYQHGDKASLQFLKVLSNAYSDQLEALAAQLRKEFVGSKVIWYDMRPLWYDAHAHPTKYGITASPVTKTCYDSTTGAVCSNPQKYLYLDALHPVTSFHNYWAQGMYAAIAQSS